MRRLRFAISTILLICLAGLPTLAAGQDPGAVMGRLTVAEKDQPVAGAVLHFAGTDNGATFSIESDEEGRFARLGIRPGAYKVTIERDGFAPVDVIGVKVLRAETIELKIEMTPIEMAPFKRQKVRYRRPIVNTRESGIVYRVTYR